MQAIYRHAVRREVVAANPTRDVDLPAARGHRERIATAPEAVRLLDALPQSDRPIWATAFYAGLRRGELQALRGTDIDLGRSEIHVQRSWDQYEGPVSPKSKAGTRTVPILSVLRERLLASDLSSGSALAFGRDSTRPFSPEMLGERAKRAWRSANENARDAAEDGGAETDCSPRSPSTSAATPSPPC